MQPIVGSAIVTGGRIEWTDRSDWNPLRGCAARFSQPGGWGEGYAHIVHTPNGPDHRWTGKVELIEERLTIPLKWQKPGRCFASSTSDFFHESLSDADIDRLFAVMISAPHIDFQVLTKRWDRMRQYLNTHRWDKWAAIARQLREEFPKLRTSNIRGGDCTPVPNVWLGVSVHDQQSANEAVPHLLASPAAIRFVSYEPALGPVDWTSIAIGKSGGVFLDSLLGHKWDDLGIRGCLLPPLDLIIAGDESGNGKRPADPDWYRQTRDQCADSHTAFFLKQMHVDGKLVGTPKLDGQRHILMPSAWRKLL